LCPDGQIPSLAAVLDPTIDSGDYIKRHDLSDVYRVQWAGRDVVVKRYNHVGLIHSLRHTIKGSRARRGWWNGQRLLRLGIPTPRPIACIDECRGPLLWRSWLITEYVDGPNLQRVLEDDDVPAGRKRRLIHQTLRLIDRMRSRGISHGDMKHTNIRCVENRVVLTDLDGMEVASVPRLCRRGRDIARFLLPLRMPADVDAGDGRERQDEGSLSFIKLTRDGCRLWINADYRQPDLEDALLAGPDVVRQRLKAEPVQSAASSRVHRLTAAFNGRQRALYLKEYLHRSLLDQMKHWIRPNRAIRSAWASRMLQARGFGAPDMVGVGEIGSGLAGSRAFTVTLEITNAVPIYRYFAGDSDAGPSCSLQERRQLLRQFGQTIGLMHRDAIVHGDLRLGNVLVRRHDGRWEFFFIDNERTRKWPWLPRRLRLKNLVQVNMLPGISNTDRLRFFQAYTVLNPRVRLRYRRWAGAVLAMTRRRWARRNEAGL
jgi:tRNA A-37 threonylcarbamoyl transferase component Bud32